MNISVCMAVRNGTNFIREQIDSILPQLMHDDEVIIVDDASQDETVSVIERYGDTRIRIIRQEQNRGVVRSFERALQEARNDIVFLTDHDDVWHPDKVAKFMRIFTASPDVSLVLSDCLIIDGQGRITGNTRFRSGGFYPGVFRTLLKNRYQGSTMAFRRLVLEYCLPFPPRIPIHDVWIGLVNQLVGRAVLIEEPLMSYRRHGKNDSRDSHAPIPVMIQWRWALLKGLIVLYMRHPTLRKHRLKGGTMQRANQ